MIPEEKMGAVRRGLNEAFGTEEFGDVCRMTRGTSPFVFRILVREQGYLLKFITRTSDPGRKIACMRAAADAGLAPHVWYTNVDDRISITDFIEALPPGPDAALVLMPRTLRALHALPQFPGVADHINTSCTFLLSKGAGVDGLMRTFRAANMLPQNACDELFDRYAQLAAVYRRRDADMVSSHNDLFKPDNVLFDGERIWLVDWEAAFLNDRYADLAVVANLVVTGADEERAFLTEYFGDAPDEHRMARYYLMRQVAHMFYAICFLLQGPRQEPAVSIETALDFEDFHQGFRRGETDLTTNERKAAFGRIHLKRLLRNMRQPRFDEALRIAAEG